VQRFQTQGGCVPQTIETYRLDNGLTIVVEPMPHVRSAAFALLVTAGSATDPEHQNGAMQIVNEMVYRGAGDKDARALSNALDDLGVQRGGSVGVEYTTFSGALLADDLPAALALYADIVRRPLLPADELEASRALAIQEIQALNDNPTQRLFVELSRVYFPGAFGRPVLGTIEDLQRIDHAALRHDYEARLRPGGGVLAVAGGVEPAQIRALAEELFGDWGGMPPKIMHPAARREPHYQHLPQDTAQTQIGVAFASKALGDADYYLERLALNVLSGGMGARLFTEVREKRGLVYSVAAVPRIYKGLGITLGYAGTQPARAQECVDVLLGELNRIREGVSADELERARIGLLSALVMQGESTAARVGAMASDIYLIDRPRSLDEIRSAVQGITLDQINSYLASTPPPAFTVLTLGPEPVEMKNWTMDGGR
jgi:predicted Zn-dependent peptidase